MASPTESAMDAVKTCCGYLKANPNFVLSTLLDPPDIDFSNALNARSELDLNADPDAGIWECFSDSDHAGNAEVQNKRRSQNGCIAVCNGAAIMWVSKVSSVAFAVPEINEAHADVSSAAAEIYAAANAANEFLHLSYCLLYTSPSPRDGLLSRMPSSA